jgi:hypothetical protein
MHKTTILVKNFQESLDDWKIIRFWGGYKNGWGCLCLCWNCGGD